MASRSCFLAFILFVLGARGGRVGQSVRGPRLWASVSWDFCSREAGSAPGLLGSPSRRTEEPLVKTGPPARFRGAVLAGLAQSL